MSKKSVAVRIAGHDYKILTDGDGAALRNFARYVDQRMDQVREQTGTVDSLDVAVLTCLNLAREVLVLRKQNSESIEDDRVRSLIERLETVLGRQPSGDVADAAEAGPAESDSSQSGSGRSSDRSEATEPVRTLDLPSVETLRGRLSPSSDETDAAPVGSSMAEARVAAVGRERAS